MDLIVGTNSYHLKAGEAIAFDASETHRYVNNSDDDAILHLTTSYE